jgi:hypothetical protein
VADPYRLISLRELMEEVTPWDLVLFGKAMMLKLAGYSYEDQIIEEDWRDACRKSLALRKATCNTLGLRFSEMQVDRLLESLHEPSLTYRELSQQFDALEDRLCDELKSARMLRLSAEKAAYYDLPLDGWDAVTDSFPSAAFDLEEAAKSFALNRHTASVFHLMRVLEIGLVTLGDHYGVNTDRSNWHEIIMDIEKSVKQLGPNDGPDWRDNQQFGSEACAQFRFFKDAWRNHVMHFRLTFDDERALTIRTGVRAFMLHLATRLKEKL